MIIEMIARVTIIIIQVVFLMVMIKKECQMIMLMVMTLDDYDDAENFNDGDDDCS